MLSSLLRVGYRYLKPAFFCLSLCAVAGCGESGQRAPSQELAEEIRNRELRHISPGQITGAAMLAGETVTKEVQAALIRKLTTAIPAEGLLAAGRYCHAANLPGADSLEKAYAVSVRRHRLKGEGNKAALRDKESQLLDAYRYSAENNQPIDPNVQSDGNLLLYSAPISLSEGVCLKCHGKPGLDLSQADYRALAGRYRLDSLVNYEAGQTLAVWMLRFNRKEIIKRIPED